jgi:hypothetical protein
MGKPNRTPTHELADYGEPNCRKANISVSRFGEDLFQGESHVYSAPRAKASGLSE